MNPHQLTKLGETNEGIYLNALWARGRQNPKIKFRIISKFAFKLIINRLVDQKNIFK